MATITDSTFPEGALLRGGAVHVNSDRTFFVTAGSGYRELFTADRSGRILRRVGRLGEGPGEYRGQPWVVETSGSFLVFDDLLNRVTALAKSTLQVQNTFSFLVQRTSNPLAFPDGRYVVAGDLRTPESRGYPLHLFNKAGQLVRSFGRKTSSVTTTLIAPARDGGVWEASWHRYSIEKWDRNGKLVAEYERRASWFPPRGTERITTPQEYANLEGLFEDSTGRLWIHLMLRRTISTQAIVQRGKSPPASANSIRLDSITAHSASVIEVLDPQTATIVATQRFPAWKAVSAFGGFYLQQPSVAASGEPLIHVWEFRLKGERQRQN